MVSNSCNTSYNVVNFQSRGDVGGGWGGGLVKKRESPDFRSPEAAYLTTPGVQKSGDV